MIRAGEFCLFHFFRGGWYNSLKLKMFCIVSLWGFQRLRSWPTGLDLGRSPECKEGGTGRERWSVRVRALLSKRPLDLKEVAAKCVSLSFLSECQDLIFFTLLITNTYGKLF